MTLLSLLLSFVQLGALSIGGGYAAMPLIRSQAVTLHGWITMGEFADLVTIAEMTPGPIALNAATFVGMRVAGVPGAVCATLGCVLPSLVIVSLMALLYRRYGNLAAVQQILSGLRPAVVALIASAGLSILMQAMFGGARPSAEGFRAQGAALFVLALALLRRWHLSPILTMLLCGAVSLLLGVAMG